MPSTARIWVSIGLSGLDWSVSTGVDRMEGDVSVVKGAVDKGLAGDVLQQARNNINSKIYNGLLLILIILLLKLSNWP